jgi:hypothetical protein
MEDLRNNIETWQAAGEYLIIMGDFNEPVNGYQIRQFFFTIKPKRRHSPTSLIFNPTKYFSRRITSN